MKKYFFVAIFFCLTFPSWAQSIRDVVASSSPNKTLYLSSEAALKGGSGSLDYLSFGDLDIDANFRQYNVYRKGSNHNAAADGDIVLIVSDNDWVSQSAEITIKSDVASYNLTNPNVFVGSGNRVFVTWSRIRAANSYELTGPGDIYVTYSDDIAGLAIGSLASATWSSEARMTTDFGELLTTSTSSINLNTLAGGGVITPTIATGLVGVVIGRVIKFASASDPTNKFFTATLTAYDSGTGVTSLTIIAKTGTTTHTDWNVALSSYIDGPGKAIHLGSGVLLKPVWTTIGASSIVRVYRSSDNGINWILYGTISTDSINPNDETCIIALPNGNIMAFIRCNTLSLMRTSFSTDGGINWSSLVTTNVPSLGKSPVAISPQGHLFGVTRDPSSSRTIYFRNTDNYYTTWTYGFLDDRTGNYMYGGVVYCANTKDFTTIVSVEAQNSLVFTGPTILVKKKITISPSIAPTAYDPDLQSVYDWTQIEGGTLPGATLMGHLSTFIAGMRSDGDLALARLFVMETFNDASLATFANRNWRYAWELLTPTNSPTFGVDGYDFNGTTQSVGTGLTPATLAASQNDIGIIMYCPENTQSSGNNFDIGASDGAFSTLTNSILVLLRFSDDKTYIRLNDNTYSSWTNTTSIGYYLFTRTASNVVTATKNGSSMGASSSAVSTGRSTQQLRIGAMKFSDQINNFSNRKSGMLIIGTSGFSDNVRTRFNTYKTAIGL